MQGARKSDRPEVPTKPPNKAAPGAAEVVEGRGLAEGNTAKRNAARTQSRSPAPNELARVRGVARKDRKARFTALFHHLTVARLRIAYRELNPKAAAGIDGVTWQQYGEHLEGNLADLHARLQRGAYRARPSRRTYIPKGDGRLRPLGVAALEDKLVQRAAAGVLNAVYETDFLGFSYGFRPGRGQHDALDALAVGLARKKVNWVLDADIRGFFDAISHEWMVRFVEHRIGDGRLLRLVQKWLAAGVMEKGEWRATQEGTPQGATISPLLANVYLHYVFDLWIQRWRSRRGRGEVLAVRYADDFIVGFQHRHDAEQFRQELSERLARFGLELHPDKTRLIEFGRFAARSRRERGLPRPESFDFLGFTHVCEEHPRSSTMFQLRRLTIRARLQRKLRAVRIAIGRRRHLPIPEQGRWLASVVRGFDQYYAVPTNLRALIAFRREVVRHWRRALRRRSQRGRLTWGRMRRLSKHWLPTARTLHPWPDERFHVNHPKQEPSALAAHAGIRAGGAG
jgi:group II intron reverse transcriptase/maturase